MGIQGGSLRGRRPDGGAHGPGGLPERSQASADQHGRRTDVRGARPDTALTKAAYDVDGGRQLIA
ncbi:hypothetical protein DMH26_03605 [Streptomyces sp. WAC 05379]|nr:hypothetical protein DMH26_03605 [Streptomyces sp. WAC 05379]